MKKAILIIALILPAVVFAQPSIVFEEVSHDFGNVDEGEVLEHVFSFRNAGTDVLIINSVKAG
jgi:hypothetical protein